ncbi:ribosome small subunit-dependent GTPase A [Azospirillum thermophilum]|uniref:Small ribosomal subunit biogenesis GTPase RsgA n=1 Tax=Azospirillum thermophilum TaxID=2202148 RepID=A0A2S2CRY3_9PROT|nr:ribosome small subunit-dependent GTPase A [Azospirillum thermophilum]AWK87238.1 ribosome small subunit-dependent GTPase A [Azospirillum thermophilum]
MARDYSRFLPTTPGGSTRTTTLSTLERLGWQPFFAQQTSVEDLARTPAVRVTEVHRDRLRVQGADFDGTIPFRPDVTVGDWLLYDRDRPAASRLLGRKSLLKRRAPGTGRQIQLIAANADTAFIVSSCNQDFNRARLERYVSVVREAGVAPVILLTKPDLCPDPQRYAAEAGTIAGDIPVVLVNALGDQPKAALADWCRSGSSVVFLGSSGVGKSSLLNALSGRPVAATRAIREHDDRGRHTTTGRRLHLLPDGCAVFDLPGMRELQLVDAGGGIASLFADLDSLARRCRFRNCGHETEPGCAVRAAVEAGEVDAARLARWRKLVREERFNSASLAERKAKDRAFGKAVRTILKQKEQERR